MTTIWSPSRVSSLQIPFIFLLLKISKSTISEISEFKRSFLPLGCLFRRNSQMMAAQYSVVSIRFTSYHASSAAKTKGVGHLEVTEGCPPPVLTALHQMLIDLNVSEKHEFSLDTKLHLWLHSYRFGEDTLIMSQHIIRTMLQRNYRMTGGVTEDTDIILFFVKDAGTVGSAPTQDPPASSSASSDHSNSSSH